MAFAHVPPVVRVPLNGLQLLEEELPEGEWYAMEDETHLGLSHNGIELVARFRRPNEFIGEDPEAPRNHLWMRLRLVNEIHLSNFTDVYILGLSIADQDTLV